MSIGAMKQWLEAFEGLLNKTSGQAIYSFMETERRIAMSACVGIRQAIAEAEKQEPVAVVQDLDEVKRKHLVYECGFDWKDPLYTHPQPKREWVGLTPEEIDNIEFAGLATPKEKRELVRAIEAKLKEKNT